MVNEFFAARGPLFAQRADRFMAAPGLEGRLVPSREAGPSLFFRAADPRMAGGLRSRIHALEGEPLGRTEERPGASIGRFAAGRRSLVSCAGDAGALRPGRACLANRPRREVSSTSDADPLSRRARARRTLQVSEGPRTLHGGAGALRRILAGYLGAAAETLQFRYGAQGKPALEGSFDLDFNLAHSHGLALIGVSRGRRLGVDLEWIRPDVADEGIAERFFAPGEVQKLVALRREDRDLAFFRCWTRKEAYIKARGEGLSIPLSSFCVSLSPEETPKLVSVEGQPSEVSRWTLHELDPGSGFAAALAVEGPVSRLHLWNWTGALGA